MKYTEIKAEIENLKWQIEHAEMMRSYYINDCREMYKIERRLYHLLEIKRQESQIIEKYL